MISASLEVLITVDVIAVMMRIDHMAKRLIGDPADRGDQRPRMDGACQRIDHHHALVSDEDPGGGDAGVVSSHTAGLDVCVGVWGDLAKLCFPGRRCRMLRI